MEVCIISNEQQGAKSVCIEVYEKMTLLLICVITSVNWFQMILWSELLVSSLLQYSMMLVLVI